MIQATQEHHLVLATTDERTAHLAEMIHNMSGWLSENLITKETYVHIHNILRQQINTENFLSVVGYRDERLEKQEYSIRVIEVPEKADGAIRKMLHKEGKFFLLTQEEAEEIKNKTEEKGEF